jgi:predicted transcriptional regulator
MTGTKAKANPLIERLQVAFNKLDHHLRATIGHRRRVPFASLIEQAVALDREDRELLVLTSRVRNLLVHDRTQPDEYAVTPSVSLVAQLELLERRLASPKRAIPTFGKAVEQLVVSDSLAMVLKRIRDRDYSQFPVYEGPAFRGLLTENGITRWLARHVTREMSLVELEDAAVKDVLKQEEDPKTNWAFVPGRETVDRVRQLFADSEMLEAVLITERGRQNEELIGIATRWDMLNWRREHKSA